MQLKGRVRELENIHEEGKKWREKKIARIIMIIRNKFMWRERKRILFALFLIPFIEINNNNNN